MKLHRILFLVVLICLAAFIAVAADVSGKWTAQMPGRDGGTREVTFDFKVDGEKLTGTISNTRTKREIAEGKAIGDDISFLEVRSFNGNEMKMVYKGKVAGNEIKFTVQREGAERTREFTAKRAS